MHGILFEIPNFLLKTVAVLLRYSILAQSTPMLPHRIVERTLVKPSVVVQSKFLNDYGTETFKSKL